MSKKAVSDYELLFRTVLSFGGEIKLVRNQKRFIVERVGLTGKYAAQFDYFEAPETAYNFYAEQVSFYPDFVVH